jgi:hypothetical protein
LFLPTVAHTAGSVDGELCKMDAFWKIGSKRGFNMKRATLFEKDDRWQSWRRSGQIQKQAIQLSLQKPPALDQTPSDIPVAAIKQRLKMLRERRYHMTIRLCIALLVAALIIPKAWANLDQDSKAELAHYVLTADTLKRLTAIAQEAKAQGIPMDPYEGSLESMSVSINSLAAKINTLHGAPSLLSKHGMTAHDYVMGGLAIIQAAGATSAPNQSARARLAKITGTPNPANIGFYQQHQREILYLLKLGASD